ncbi:MAG: hypothetical protein HWQ38_00995 [Nostoc sp. NMS7]|uniref:hypothetical protein n=1 Tax=Nostoc sp. NMS7 TaxID=2815391 RepID=UPI0025E656F3|nr:hypothetical protein [Nostoc sp. NMS7]MBN3945132.1 hypothetical protein [Nostoc sp. NMS7]
MASIFHKDSLFWANTVVFDNNYNEIAWEDYLFTVERFSEVFWYISNRMAQLNDYCVLTLQETENHYTRLLRQRHKLENDPNAPAEDFDVLDYNLPKWEDTIHTVSRATCILLLSAFLEHSLKLLCAEFTPGVQVKKLKRASDIDSYLAHLKHQGGLQFQEYTDTLELRNVIRKVRNDFAHGTWDNVRINLAQLNLRDAFGTVSNLLYKIEDAAWNSEWGSKT